jgi:Protein of unknown function (DUF998)
VPRGERFVNGKTTPPCRRTEASVKTKTLLACGAIAGPLFVLVFLVEGATRAHYDPLRHPVSSLAFGDVGWTQRANFLITGLLMLAFAIGLRRALRPLAGPTWGPLLVGAYAIGLLGAGIFVADPMNGYPPGTPDKRLIYSTRCAPRHVLDPGLSGAPSRLHRVRPLVRRARRARVGDLLGGYRRRLLRGVHPLQRGFRTDRRAGGPRRAVPARHAHRRLRLGYLARRPFSQIPSVKVSHMLSQACRTPRASSADRQPRTLR